MSRTSKIVAGAFATLILATGASFAQGANGGGGRGDGGSAGGGATMMPATMTAVVPGNQPRQPRPFYSRNEWGGCPTPTEGRRGPRLVNSCGPE